MEKIRMIRENMKEAQSRQKKYYDKMMNLLNFEEGRSRLREGGSGNWHWQNLTQLKDNLTFETIPLRITDRSVKALRGKEIALVKVIWSQANGENVTWEVDEAIRESYLYLFS
ncbi:PREDICTED: uncharacterized protein LOC109332494 [Lupinus angustifolius]|uniref:uncharacterized protein LOC109332494 n=1 Tax=Lupinus angustifolius TaxID=3871 RepID=UPI00092F880F|nr:PREDICTED: uncharacterized protein LOC109332494 [Lupinus angustifolius]